MAFVSLVIAIQFRRLDSHGLIPYLYNLIQNGIDVDLVMFIIHYTFTFSFGLTTFLIENLEYQPEYLIYSLHIYPAPYWICIRNRKMFKSEQIYSIQWIKRSFLCKTSRLILLLHSWHNIKIVRECIG